MIRVNRRYPRINHINWRKFHFVKFGCGNRRGRIFFNRRNNNVIFDNAAVKIQRGNFYCTADIFNGNFNAVGVGYVHFAFRINRVFYGVGNNFPRKAQNFFFDIGGEIFIWKTFARAINRNIFWRRLTYGHNLRGNFVAIFWILR